MRINPLKWNVKTFIGILLFYFLVLYKKQYNVSLETTVKYTKPYKVWEFFADFSNMKKLNPTLMDFNIISESGGYQDWRYSVEYTERLSHFPMIKSTANGHFSVKPSSDGFLINSQHYTCFLFGFGCLTSISQLKFNANGEDTKCVETVEYECPIILSTLCHREVMYQREEIMKNLKLYFPGTSSKENK